MNAEYISYCCSRTEWETVRLLLALNVPIGLQDISMDAETCQAAYDSLCEEGLLTPVGDEVVVDRLLALLVTQACSADLALALRSGERHVLLHRAPDMVLLSEWTLEHCQLTPLPNAVAARNALFAALARCRQSVDLELLQTQKAVKAATAANAADAQAPLEKLYTDFCVYTLNNA